jgi:thiamine-phosphate pyrophosphorylase
MFSRDTSRPILCYVTDRNSLPVNTESARIAALLERSALAARAGVNWIQIREKNLEASSLVYLARQAMACSVAASASPAERTKIFVNDRLDVALASGADGVHLGELGLPPNEVVRWRQTIEESDFRVGASSHSMEAVRRLAQAGVDYIFFGPIFATPSKIAFGAPQGLEKLREACNAVPVPILAIGGITTENAAACLKAGAAGIAGIRLFQETTDLSNTMARIRNGM